MECRYCGKEVPLRMRLTGQTGFCCSSHRKLYHEEHSRIGLARLLEETSSDEKEAVAVREAEEPEQAPVQEALKTEVEEPVAAEDIETSGHPDADILAEPTADTSADVLPEPTADISADVLRLWRYSPVGFSPQPLFERSTRLRFDPADYTPGEPEATVAVITAESNEPDAASAESSPAAKPASGRLEAEPPQDFDFHFGTPGLGPSPEMAKRSPLSVKIAVAGALAVAAAAVAYLNLDLYDKPETAAATDAATSDSEAAIPEEGGEWIPYWSDGRDGDDIALFGPSQEWSDYRIESKVDRYTGIALVFRAADPGNYYALRLEAGRYDNHINLIRYAVVNGESMSRVETPVPTPNTDLDTFGIQLEARGSTFQVFLEGHLVAKWTDSRLSRGGVGVISKKMDLASVSSVKVTQLVRNSAFSPQPRGIGAPSAQLATITITRMDGVPAFGQTHDQDSEESN
jgi:hypothetical protein